MHDMFHIMRFALLGSICSIQQSHRSWLMKRAIVDLLKRG